MQSLTIIAEVADGIGMFGFAVAGLFASAGRRIDPVGVFVSVFTTAFGGGIIRDILLDLRPFYWLSHPQWIWMTLGLTILAPVIVRRVQRFWQRRILLWADAVGLAFFAVGSCATSDRLGHPLIVSVLIGVVTGVFGGMLRDVFCAKLPCAFQRRALRFRRLRGLLGIPRSGARRTRAGRHRALGLLRPHHDRAHDELSHPLDESAVLKLPSASKTDALSSAAAARFAQGTLKAP